MNTTTETVVPPAPDVAKEAPAAQLPTAQDVAAIRVPEPMRDEHGEPIRAHGHTATKDFGQVVGAIADVMADLTPVGKGGTNTFHNYKYARMQDILQMLTPLMGRHGIVVFQYEAERNMFDDGRVLAITYRFVVAHKSGQTWIDPVPQTGMSPCRTSNGKFDDKAFAKCHTSARKYFLLSLFQIPTEDENDPDSDGRQERSAGPVPSPDGHLTPHLIQPMQRDTFDAWADRYLKAAATSKTVAELDEWDRLNDDPLTQMDANEEKGRPVYERILKMLAVVRERLQPPSHTDAAPTSAEFYDKNPPPAEKQQTRAEFREEVKAAAAGRPDGCPDAEKDPEGFMTWAEKRLREVAARAGGDPTELSLIYESEVMANADGLFKPDVDAIKAIYDELLAKVGG